MTDRRLQIWVDLAVFLLLAAAVWVTFGRAVSVPFFYDDYPAVVENESLRKLWPLSVPLRAPRDSPFSARPMVNFSAAVNYRLGELNPTGYRQFNMAVHTASAMLLFVITRRALALWQPVSGLSTDGALPKNALALAIALLWAVHPLQTESVCYVTQRTELMMGLAYLATLYASLRYWAADSPAARGTWLALAVLACLAGMASKEVMASAPLVVLLFDRAFVSGSFGKAWRNSWPLYLGLALTWGLLAFLAADAPRSASAGFHLSLSPITWWLTQCKVVLMYLRLAIWPWPLAIHYEIPYLTNFSEAWPYAAVVSLIVVGVFVALWRNWPSGFLGAWFFLILAPTLLVPIPTEVAAERRMYLPLAAVIGLVVVGAYRTFAKSRQVASSRVSSTAGKWYPGLAILLASLSATIALVAVSNRRLAVYHDPVTLWRDTLAQYPRSELAHANVGFALMRAGNDGEALEQLNEAIALNPAADDAHFNLGILYKKQGRLQESANHYGESSRLLPNNPGRHNDYGCALLKLRQFPQALDEFQQALQLEPDMYDARFNLALALAASGNVSEAIAEYQRILDRRPDDANSHYGLANALILADKTEPAIAHFEQAVKLKPDFVDAQINLGGTLLHVGKSQEAIGHLERAVHDRPDSVVGHFNLAEAYRVAGRTENALTEARRALELAKTGNQTQVAAGIEAWLSSLEANNSANPTTKPDADK